MATPELPDSVDSPSRQKELEDRITALRAQKQANEDARSRNRRKIMGVVVAGALPCLAFVLLASITHTTAYAMVAVLFIAAAIITLQKVTARMQAGISLESHRATLFLKESEDQLESLRQTPEASRFEIDKALTLLKQGGKKEKLTAIEALGRCGAGSDAVTNTLVQMLKNPQAAVKIAALKALGRLAPADKTVIDKLIAAMKFADRPDIRFEAAVTLASIGKPALEATVDVLMDKNASSYLPSNMRHQALLLFGQSVIAPVIEIAEKQDNPLAALSILGSMPDLPPSVASFLIKTYEQHPGYLDCLKAFGRITPPCLSAVEKLTSWLSAETDSQRQAMMKIALANLQGGK